MLRSRLELVDILLLSTLLLSLACSMLHASPSLILRSRARFFFSAFLLFFIVFAKIVEFTLYICCCTFSLNLTDFLPLPLNSATWSSEMVVVDRLGEGAVANPTSSRCDSEYPC